MTSKSGWMLLLQAVAVAFAGAVFVADVAAQEAKPARQDLLFKGDAKCTRCHDAEDDFPVLEIGKTRHGTAGKQAGITCTSCHGDSDSHVNKPADAAERPKPDRVFNRKGAKILAEKRAEACLACHQNDRHLAFWDSGRHKKNDVACDNCHVVHERRHNQLRRDNPVIAPIATSTRQNAWETCVNCHRDIRAQLMRPSHHPIMEGKVQCSSCHNPHGALSPNMVVNESVNQLCTSCHADKRGPYMHEHPPVEENCLTCHNPHGSRSVKLLREKVPNLCQDCHDAAQHPGSAYDMTESFKGSAPSSRFVARGCLNCHNEIHGSNAPGGRGRRFIR